MNGLLIGFLLGTGTFFIWSAFWQRPTPRSTVESARVLRMRDTLAQAGLGTASFRQIILGCLAAALFGAGIAYIIVPVPALILVLALGCGCLPIVLVRGRALRHQMALAKTWPEVIEHLVSGVSAGLSLPEAVAELAVRGPAELRSPFAEFAADYRVSGNFTLSLDRLKARLADPVADRVIEALRLARDVGGNNLGTLLRNLTQFLHDDLRTRGEIEARQSWTVAGSRLAVAAPWVILVVLSSRGEASIAYRTPLGTWLILAGAAITFFAYRAMIRLGRLPGEERILR